jgi:hypothetical protein
LDDLAVAVAVQAALKKQYGPVNWLWADSAATVSHL